MQKRSARHAVQVQRSVHVTEPGGSAREGRDRLDLTERTAFAQARRRHRQDHPSARGQCTSQLQIRRPIRRFRLGEQDVECDALCAIPGCPIDQPGVGLARPGPASEVLKASLVDRDDHYVILRRRREAAYRDVVDEVVDASECIGVESGAGDDEHEQSHQGGFASGQGARSPGRGSEEG
jgi:hypothetical protein